MRGWKRYIIPVIGLAISLSAAYSILAQLPLSELVGAFQTARYSYVLPSLILVLLGLWFRGVRWRVLLNDELNVVRSFNIMNIGYLVNGLLPLRLGEVARAYLASRAAPQIPVVRALSTIVIERLIDLLTVLVILGIAIAIAPVPEELRAIAAVGTPALIVGFLLLIVMSSQRARAMRIVEGIAARFAILQRIRFATLVQQFLDGIAPLTQPRMLFRVLLWTVIAWTFSVISGFVLMPAFFDAPDWSAVFLFTAAASFANALPAAPGSIGVYEGSILLSFQSLGYTGVAAITGFAVMIHALNVGSNAVLGIIGFIQEGVTLSQLSERVRGLQQPS
jgi:hypothetical protein